MEANLFLIKGEGATG